MEEEDLGGGRIGRVKREYLQSSAFGKFSFSVLHVGI